MTDAQALYGSDHLARSLGGSGYDFVALDPRTAFRGHPVSLIHMSAALGIGLAAHEEIAVAIAPGYAKASGRRAAAAIHDVVGLQHASMAIFNTLADQVPNLLPGATGRLDASERRPFIDRVHTASIPGDLVRDHVKWDDQPASLMAAFEAITRARPVAVSEPPGPVHACLDSTIRADRVAAEPPRSVPTTREGRPPARRRGASRCATEVNA